MNVGEAVGRALALLGVTTAFGVVGSGNFHVTNGLVAGGARFVAARHEGGAATMADSYARLSGEVGLVSVHQGCGLTNAATGIGEAAKSRTPMIVVSGEMRDRASNFFMDQDGFARSVGAESHRVRSAATAVADVRRAYACALRERRTVLLNLPVDVQGEEFDADQLDTVAPVTALDAPQASGAAVDTLVDLLLRAERPVFIAGRGARGPAARDALTALAEDCGALLAEGAVAKGLFAGPWSIGVSGGFSSPLTAELIAGADLVVGWGTSLNMWTTRHGRLLAEDATLVQVDIEAAGIERNRPVDLGMVGDVAATARQAAERMAARGQRSTGYRTPELRERIAASARWRDVPYDDVSTDTAIDPRTLSIALDDALPANRVVGVDSGNFMGYPSMYLSVPDEYGFSFTQAFQSIGLGLATAVGAAVAQPDRVPVAACGDGGFLMGIAELETVVRLGLGMVIVVYNDHAYGAEVYHFGPQGHPVDSVNFPDTDIAAIARGYGCDALTVRTASDLKLATDRIARGVTAPLVIDAKVVGGPSWWLQEAMRH